MAEFLGFRDHVNPRISYFTPKSTCKKVARLHQGCNARKVILEVYTSFVLQSPKFKRVSFNETFEFPFWGLNISVDFDLRDLKKMEKNKKHNIS